MGLMARGQYRVARRYIIYRSEHAKMRPIRARFRSRTKRRSSMLSCRTGPACRSTRAGSEADRRSVPRVRGDHVSVDELVDEAHPLGLRRHGAGRGVPRPDPRRPVADRRRDPVFDVVASRLMRNVIYQEVLGETPEVRPLTAVHRDQFEHLVIDGIQAGRLAPELR